MHHLLSIRVIFALCISLLDLSKPSLDNNIHQNQSSCKSQFSKIPGATPFHSTSRCETKKQMSEFPPPPFADTNLPFRASHKKQPFTSWLASISCPNSQEQHGYAQEFSLAPPVSGPVRQGFAAWFWSPRPAPPFYHVVQDNI